MRKRHVVRVLPPLPEKKHTHRNRSAYSAVASETTWRCLLTLCTVQHENEHQTGAHQITKVAAKQGSTFIAHLADVIVVCVYDGDATVSESCRYHSDGEGVAKVGIY